jgi:hypothetical protein
MSVSQLFARLSRRVVRRDSSSMTYLPLGESQVHLATSLGDQSLVLLEASANGTGGNGQVSVVAIPRKGCHVLALLEQSVLVVLAARGYFANHVDRLRKGMTPKRILGRVRSQDNDEINSTYVMPAAFHAAVILASGIED